MSNVIRVISKQEMANGTAADSSKVCCVGLALVDSSNSAPVQAQFLQTASAVAGMVGITPYGGLVFNTVNSGMSDIITVTAHPLAESDSTNDISITTTLTAIMATAVLSNLSNGSKASITVNSAAGTAVGDTKITVSGYTKPSDCDYYYKVASGTAPSVSYGDVLDDTWTKWNGTDDITAASTKKITIASANKQKEVLASGSATVTARS